MNSEIKNAIEIKNWWKLTKLLVAGTVAITVTLPSTITKPIAETLTETALDLAPKGALNKDKAEVRNRMNSSDRQATNLEVYRSWDAGRAILSAVVVGLIEIPAALPNALPHMAEFSRHIPDFVPEVAAAAAIIYGLSWINMNNQLRNLPEE